MMSDRQWGDDDLMLLRINNFPISSSFGSIDSIHKIPHKGLDIAMPEGTPLHSIADGIILRINDEGIKSFGKSIRIKLHDGTEVIYGHLSQIKAKVGESIYAGDIIGLSGNTGHSTGPHLHLQLVATDGKLIDPTPWYAGATDGAIIPELWRKGTQAAQDALTTRILSAVHDWGVWFINSGIPILAEMVLIWGMVCFAISCTGSAKWVEKGVKSVLASIMLGMVNYAI